MGASSAHHLEVLTQQKSSQVFVFTVNLEFPRLQGVNRRTEHPFRMHSKDEVSRWKDGRYTMLFIGKGK